MSYVKSGASELSFACERGHISCCLLVSPKIIEPSDTRKYVCVRWLSRLDFRRFLECGLRSSPRSVRERSAGSFPKQRLVIEPAG